MNSDLTPHLKEMLRQMRDVLTRDDLRAGLPLQPSATANVLTLYAQWTSLYKELERQQQTIADLDADIRGMEPWGDFPMSNIDKLAAKGVRLQFWRMRSNDFDMYRAEWSAQYQSILVSESGGFSYFTTQSPVGTNLYLPGAELQRVAPSPVSTLIMLQTRIKDARRSSLIKLGDFALTHYLEVEAALGLHDTLPAMSKRSRLKEWIQKKLSLKKK